MLFRNITFAKYVTQGRTEQNDNKTGLELQFDSYLSKSNDLETYCSCLPRI